MEMTCKKIMNKTVGFAIAVDVDGYGRHSLVKIFLICILIVAALITVHPLLYTVFNSDSFNALRMLMNSIC